MRDFSEDKTEEFVNKMALLKLHFQIKGSNPAHGGCSTVRDVWWLVK